MRAILTAISLMMMLATQAVAGETFICSPDLDNPLWKGYPDWHQKYVGEFSEEIADPIIIAIDNDEITNVTLKTFYFFDGLIQFEKNSLSSAMSNIKKACNVGMTLS